MRHDLFATPVWHIEGAPQQLVYELYEKVDIIKKKKDLFDLDDYNKSNQGGYQTSQFDWQEFHPVGIEYIENVVNNIFSPKSSVSIVGWWYNINPQGAWNAPHNHAGVDYALVFYLTDSDSLLRFLTPHNSRINEPNHQSINAKKGDILIFPSDLGHYVMPNPREEDRVSISMNLQLC